MGDDVEKRYTSNLGNLAAKYVSSNGEIEVQYRFARSAAFDLYLDAFEVEQTP